jgi:hypothetical protein
MKMVKVLPSAKVSRPTGDLGSYPQRTAPNPSQRNGMSPPKDPPRLRDIGEPAPSATKGHLSNAIRADLGKLEPSQRAGILRAADEK